LQVVWKHFSYIMYWLYRGVWPDRDVDGNMYTTGVHYRRALKPLAGGWFGILWNIRMDLDWEQWQFHLTDYANGFACSLCPARRTGPNLWTDCRYPEAAWIPSTWNRESHRLHFGDTLHRLFRVLPHFGICNYLPDVLHCKWLGADQYYLGSTLALLTHHSMPQSPQENLQVVMQSIREAYALEGVATKDQYKVMRVSMYKGGKANHIPKLKGTGMQCQGLSTIMPRVFEAHMDPGNGMHRRVLLGLKAIRNTDRILHEHQRAYRFPQDAAAELVQSSFFVAQVVTSLIKHFHPRRMPLFHYTIKQHYCLHIALASQWTSPLMGDCSSGESFMKIAKRQIRGSMHGNAPSKAANVATAKYLKALHLQLDRTGDWWLY
jgi:hypothetical protein